MGNVPQVIYKTRIYFSCQVSGAMKIQRKEHKNQMTEDKGQTVFCPLSSDLWSLLSDPSYKFFQVSPISFK